MNVPPNRVDCPAGRSCDSVELHRVDFGHSQRPSASKGPFAQHCWCFGILVRDFLVGRHAADVPRRPYLQSRCADMGLFDLSSFRAFLSQFACGSLGSI
jgi:hypothetical protein